MKRILILIALAGVLGVGLMVAPRFTSTEPEPEPDLTMTVPPILAKRSGVRFTPRQPSAVATNSELQTREQIIADYEARRAELVAYGATLKRPGHIPENLVTDKMSPEMQDKVLMSFQRKQAKLVVPFADYIEKQSALEEELRAKLGDAEYQQYRNAKDLHAQTAP